MLRLISYSFFVISALSLVIGILWVPIGLGLEYLMFDVFPEWGRAHEAAYDWDKNDQYYSPGAVIFFSSFMAVPSLIGICLMFWFGGLLFWFISERQRRRV